VEGESRTASTIESVKKGEFNGKRRLSVQTKRGFFCLKSRGTGGGDKDRPRV